MSQINAALAFPPSRPDIIFNLAAMLAVHLKEGRAISRALLNQTLSDAFGGSDADGCWSVRDAHALLELVQILFLKGAARPDWLNDNLLLALAPALTAVTTATERCQPLIPPPPLRQPPEAGTIHYIHVVAASAGHAEIDTVERTIEQGHQWPVMILFR